MNKLNLDVELCPCCKGISRIVASHIEEKGSVHTYYQIICTHCGLRTGRYVLPESAIFAWNRRDS